MKNSIVKIFPDSDLRRGHLGLKIDAAKRNVNVGTLEHGEFVMFLNRRQDKFKLYAANNTLVYYTHTRGRINLEAVKYFPQIFNAGQFSYDKALEKVLTRRLER
jgi:hypothetical protein